MSDETKIIREIPEKTNYSDDLITEIFQFFNITEI